MNIQLTTQMKRNLRVCLLVLFASNISFGQLWYYRNNDRRHQAIMVELIAYLGVQNAENILMEVELNKAVSKLRDELLINYTTTTGPYDKTSDFLTGTSLRAANAVMGTMLTTSGWDAYFPQTKRDYLNNINSQSFSLIWLQWMNSNKIRNADRQRVYRIRREILKAYSDDERRARALLMIMAAFYAGENIETVATTLKALEIIN